MEIYLDYNSTTAARPEVVELITSSLNKSYHNPNSIHKGGVSSRYAIEKARRKLLKLLDAPEQAQLIYTSCGSESNNLALKGYCLKAREQGRGDHLVVSATEHSAVLETAIQLRDSFNFDVTFLPVDKEGRVSSHHLRESLRKETTLVSIIAANNETGVINDIERLSATTHINSKAIFHTDAVQAIGKIPFSIQNIDADLVTFASHKVHGPKGIGMLYMKEPIELLPQISGGQQEHGLRAGTENIAYIEATTRAIEIALEEMNHESTRLVQFREKLWKRLERLPFSIQRNTPEVDTLPGTLNVSIPGTKSQELVRELSYKGIYCSAGSACTSGGETYSHVIESQFQDADRASSALRISFGKYTREEEIDIFVQTLEALLPSLIRVE